MKLRILCLYLPIRKMGGTEAKTLERVIVNRRNLILWYHVPMSAIFCVRCKYPASCRCEHIWMPLTGLFCIGHCGGNLVISQVTYRLQGTRAIALHIFLIPATLIFHTNFGDQPKNNCLWKNLAYLGWISQWLSTWLRPNSFLTRLVECVCIFKGELIMLSCKVRTWRTLTISSGNIVCKRVVRTALVCGSYQGAGGYFTI